MGIWTNRLVAAGLVATTAVAPTPALGMSIISIGQVTLQAAGACTAANPTTFFNSSRLFADANDGGGGDLLQRLLLDGNNTILDEFTNASGVGDTLTGNSKKTIATPAARPFRLAFFDAATAPSLYDIGDTFNLADAMPGGILEFDPATLDPSCGVYPDLNAQPPTAAITSFLQSRVDLLLANTPDIDRRMARLSRAPAPSSQQPGAAVMEYVSRVAQGSPVPVSGSLAAIDAMDGILEPSPFDIWFDGTFALFDNAGPHGRFSTASVGADYLINADFLVGGFFSLDRIDQFNWATSDVLAGTGWLAGPYLTARLSDNLYLDLLTGAGTADNTIDTGLGFVDSFDSTRWLVNASLSGNFSAGPWSFTPRLGVSYGEETSKAYTDGAGTAVPSVMVGLGQISAGPGIIHTSSNEGVMQTLSLRLDAVQGFGSVSALSARPEAGVIWAFGTGFQFGATATYSGLGSTHHSVGVSLSASGGF